LYAVTTSGGAPELCCPAAGTIVNDTIVTTVRNPSTVSARFMVSP
jgi:hypothetical protein